MLTIYVRDGDQTERLRQILDHLLPKDEIQSLEIATALGPGDYNSRVPIYVSQTNPGSLKKDWGHESGDGVSSTTSKL